MVSNKITAKLSPQNLNTGQAIAHRNAKARPAARHFRHQDLSYLLARSIMRSDSVPRVAAHSRVSYRRRVHWYIGFITHGTLRESVINCYSGQIPSNATFVCATLWKIGRRRESTLSPKALSNSLHVSSTTRNPRRWSKSGHHLV